jgi:dipeptidyl aminopeptidase/acylaminoacyl peptidase
MRNALVLTLLVAAFSTAAGAAGARTLAIADMARIASVEEPAISPDGAIVAAVVVRQDVAAAAYVNSLVLVDVGTARSHTVATGRDVAVPRWSPDGSRMAFLQRASAGGNLQLFLRRSDGAIAQITHAQGDVIDFQWSPDGRRIAYVAADVPANRAALAAHHDYFFAGDNDYTATALTPPDHLWIVPASGGSARRLTHGTWTIAPTDPGGIFSPQIAWTPDGRSITFTRVENTFSGDDENSTLWQVAASGGVPHKLTSHPRFEFAPSYAAKGASLAYWYPRDGEYMSENSLRVVTAAGDEVVAPELDRNIAGTLWYPDGKRFLICATDHTRTLAWTAGLTGSAKLLPLGDLNIVCDPYSSSTFDSGIAGSLDRNGGLAFVGTDDRHARELYYLAPHARAPRRLTHFNDFIAGLSIGRMKQFDWNGPDGFSEDGVVTYPPGFDPASGKVPARPFPIVLLIHGGPGLSSTRDFVWEGWPLAQAIASHGYVVFSPNYRGSDNDGNAFMHAIAGDTAQGPGNDIMAGLAALEKMPYVDDRRVAVTGWSYGGLLASWLIGHYHAWRAAVSGAAVNDETEEYVASTSNVQNTFYLGTSPYNGDGPRIYATQSPITYYRDITTPTLIWGTTGDPVVPIPQQYALFHALLDNHVPVRFVVFPASSHGPSTPVQVADLTRIWLEWLDAHLK